MVATCVRSACTSAPSVTCARPTRPLIGARILVSIEIELRARDVGPARGDVGLGLPQVGDRESSCDCAIARVGHSASARCAFCVSWFEHGLRLGERRPRGVELDLERLGVELVQHVAGLDVAALLEVRDARRCPTRGRAPRRCASARCGRAVRGSPAARRLQFEHAHLLDRRRFRVGSGRGFRAGRQGEGCEQDAGGEAPRRPDRMHGRVGRGGIRVLLFSQLRRRVGDKKCSI